MIPKNGQRICSALYPGPIHVPGRDDVALVCLILINAVFWVVGVVQTLRWIASLGWPWILGLIFVCCIGFFLFMFCPAVIHKGNFDVWKEMRSKAGACGR
jgi:hypothetical protein